MSYSESEMKKTVTTNEITEKATEDQYENTNVPQSSSTTGQITLVWNNVSMQPGWGTEVYGTFWNDIRNPY